MKKHFITGMLLCLSVTSYAQSAKDIKRLEAQKAEFTKNIADAESFLNEDRTSKFACHPDFKAPFEVIQKAALEKTAATKADFEKAITELLENGGKNGLKTLVAEIETRKREIKAEKNKIRKAELKKALAAKIKVAQDVAQLAKNDLEPKFKADIQSLVTVGGNIQIAMDEDESDLQVTTIFKSKESIQIANGMGPAEIYNKNIIKLLDSCESKDCVFLMSAEIKNYFVKTAKVNQDVKIISGITAEKNKIFSKKKVFAKLDEMIAALAKGKPLADLDPACMPKPQKPQKPQPNDDGNDDGGGKVEGDKTDEGGGEN